VRALEPAFMQLVDRAEQAGWCSEEVLQSLALLARLVNENKQSVQLVRYGQPALMN
jgi:hypothetical protein